MTEVTINSNANAHVMVIAENKDIILFYASTMNAKLGEGVSYQQHCNSVTPGGSSEYKSSSDTGNGTSVCIFVLPKNYSRHNTSSRSHSLRSFAKSKKSFLGATQLSIVILTTVPEHAFALAVEVSRHFPHFSMKSGAGNTSPRSVSIAVDGSYVNDAFIASLAHVARGVRLCQYIVDAPPNVINVNAYVDECLAVADRLSCRSQVIRGEDLNTQGFGGIWNVGKASVELPALVILSYIPPDSAPGAKSICLVGKGIVFDTGGLSVKTGGGMVGMKRDLGGSAAILAAFEALVASKACTAPLHALLCIAENSISACSTRPDDIITMYSGKTVEINNIDASGDLVHPVPYAPEFFSAEFSSDCADMTNSVADRTNAQCSCAAQFVGNHIESFVNGGGRWLHIDMAYPVHVGERATGYGVALLYHLVQALSTAAP